MELLSLGVIILTIYSGLYYQAGQGDTLMQNEIVSYLIFAAVLFPSLIFAANFFKKIWHEILKVVAVKSSRVFRFLTCSAVDIVEFKRMFINEISDDEENEYEKKAAPAKSTDL